MFEDQIEPTIQSIKSRLISRKQTIATAESCTSGLLAYCLTSVSGSSEYFKQGWVVYHPDSKYSELCLPRHIDIYSEECAIHLAKAAKAKAGTDWSIGITGNVEPGGKIWYAIAYPDSDKIEPHCVTISVPAGTRKEIRQNVAHTVLVSLKNNMYFAVE